MKFTSQLNPGAVKTFQSATGEPIPNFGDLRLPLYTREGTVRGMAMKASPVTKPLGLVFDDEGPSS